MNEIVVVDCDQIAEPDLKGLGLDTLEVKRLSDQSALQLGARDRVYYFLSLMGGGLKYQTDFIAQNREVTQWILVAATDNSWAVDGFLSTLAAADTAIQAVTAGGKRATQIKRELASLARIRAKTCLIYAKRAGVGKGTVAALLKEKLCPQWTFQQCDGSEENFRQECQGMNRVIIMGNSLQDFSLCRPELLNVNPIFLYHRCDEEVQLCLRPELLWDEIRTALAARDWMFPESYPDFYVGSALYESWAMECESGDIGSLSLQERFVMWDRFGLPVAKEEYTTEKIRSFLTQFNALRKIGLRLNGCN